MAQYKVIDMSTWSRSRTFEFYRRFANPSYSINVQYSIEPLYKQAKKNGDSFFLLTLYAILRAANEVPQLRQRYINGQVIEYEQLAAMTPIMTPNEEFCQAWCEFRSDFPQFKEVAHLEIEAAKKAQPGPRLNHDEDYICASCVPWLHFTGGTQADFTFNETVPILAWGKMQENKIPIIGRFNHYFVDGLHFSRFFNKIELYFKEPDQLYHPENKTV